MNEVVLNDPLRFQVTKPKGYLKLFKYYPFDSRKHCV